MPSIFATCALLPEGWATNVRVEISAAGRIEEVEVGSTSRNAAVSTGPLLPGMPNVHCHAFQRALAGLTERRAPDGQDSFWTWRRVMYDFVANLGPEDVHAIAAQLYVELLKNGFTSVGEFHYLHNQADGTPYDDAAEMSVRVIEAARLTGIAVTHLPAVYMFGGFGGLPLGAQQHRFRASPETAMRIIQALRARYAEEPLVRLGLAPHSLRAVDAPMLRDAVAELHRADPDAAVHIHVAEQTKEVEDCLARSGRTPVAWLLDNMAVNDHWCIIHATHANNDEIERLAKSGAVVGLCPTTEANLGDGLFRLSRFRECGGAIAVGSDSNVSVSPIEELRWLEYGQRLSDQRRAVVIDPGTGSVGRALWQAAVRGGVTVLRQGAATIAVGQRADLVALQADHPALQGKTGDLILDSLIFSGNDNLIRHVMVGGKWLVRDGHHALEEQTSRAFAQAVQRLAQ